MSTEELTKHGQWQRLFSSILGYQATWIIDIGLKAGLFRAIADAGSNGVSEETIAQMLGFAPRYVQVWCRAAYAYELLDWDEYTGYRLAPHIAALLLDPSDPQFMGGRFQFYAALYEDFRAFPTYLRTGEIWPRSAHDPWLLEALKNTTKPDAAMLTEHVLPHAPHTLAQIEQSGALLDIGSGAGFHLVHYARRFPHAHVVGIESDAASVELARQTIADAGVAERVEIRHADANVLDDAQAYDLITMNIALHETGGPAEYRNVLRRVRRALKSNGTLIVSELPYPDSPRAYRDGAVYKTLSGVQFHEALVGCGMITQGQLRDLLLDTGFANVRVVEQPIAARLVMMAQNYMEQPANNKAG